MIKIRCIIIDDEPWAINLLKSYIEKVEYLDLVYADDNPVRALNHITIDKPDLVFLDIRMPELSGLQIMEAVGHTTNIIVTSAYTEYAIQGYEHNIVDYLTKPIEFTRFFKAVEKAKDIFENAVQVKKENPARNYFFVKTDGRLVKVNFDDLLFIEGLKDYIAVNTKQGKLICLDSLLNMESLLPSDSFLRIHKSYIISVDKIDTIERNRVFIGEHVIPVGEQYKQNLNRVIGR